MSDIYVSVSAHCVDRPTRVEICRLTTGTVMLKIGEVASLCVYLSDEQTNDLLEKVSAFVSARDSAILAAANALRASA